MILQNRVKQFVEHFDTFISLWGHARSSPRRIVDFRNRKLRSVITHAYQAVPYYRQLFDDAGIDPNHIRTIQDLHSIPVSTSLAYRREPLERVLSRSVHPERLACHNTSGSTGRPMTIMRSPSEEHLLNCFRMRTLPSCGVRLSDRISEIAMVGLHDSKIGFLKRLRRASGLYRTHVVDCLQPPEMILKQLVEQSPDVISGYPGFLSHLAIHVLSGQEPKPTPRLILTGGESLTSLRRKRIQEAFQAPISDSYGAHEFNLLAWECPETGYYHVTDDGVVVEIIKDGRPARVGEKGIVVATALHSYAMPFIRYELGDVATRGPDLCPCGQPFSTLKSIDGRTKDYFSLPDGRSIHPNEILVPVTMQNMGWIEQYRIVQETADRVVLSICALRPPDTEALERIERLGREVLGDGTAFSVRLVDGISPDPSGKFSVTESLVDRSAEVRDA